MTRSGTWLSALAVSLLRKVSTAEAREQSRIVKPFVGTLADFGQRGAVVSPAKSSGIHTASVF